MERYLIGIDVGTTGTKSMLLSEHGEIIAHAYCEYPCQTPATGRVEQDAEDWWRAIVKTVREIVAKPGRAERVVALSLSLQGGTLVPVDQDLRPLHPAIVWSDKRCEQQNAAFKAKFGPDYMYRKTGWHLNNGLNALQTAWLRDNCPDVYRKAAMWLSVPDYVSMKLTGRAVVDISDVGINQLADIRTGEYDQDILAFAGIREDQLPEIAFSGTPVGTLTKQAAEELGLPESVLFVTGAHDQYAALLGAGITQTGDVLIGTGTCWVVTALSDEPYFESGFAQSIPACGKWGSLVSLSTGGVSRDWCRNGVAGLEAAGLSYAQINELAASREIGAGGLKFYPYFNGTAFPLKGGSCKATFVGLDLSHDRGDMLRAVMEGVAMQTAWTLDFFRDRFPLKSVKMSGGGAKSPFWTQMMCDIADCPISVPTVKDLTCIGAGVLAGVGAGVFSSCEEGIRHFNLPEKRYEPDPERAKRYRAAFEGFKDTARRLTALYGD